MAGKQFSFQAVRSSKKKVMDIFEHKFNEMKSSESIGTLATKCISDSLCCLALPFKQDPDLRADYINHRGDIKVGALLEDMDAFAGYCAYAHCAKGISVFPTIVTASMDKMDLHGSLDADQDLQLVGAVTHVGYSSMNVDIDVATLESCPQSVMSASFTFVARDGENNSLAVPTITPKNEDEQRLEKRGRQRQAGRKSARVHSLSKQPPSVEELEVLHQIFTDHNNAPPSNTKHIKHQHDRNTAYNSDSDEVMSLAMKDTRMGTTVVCHPQMRNVHNKVFGGYLMRKAYELAWANANVVTRGPVYFLELDDIFFQAPVEVGSLVEFQARSTYGFNSSGSEIPSTLSVSVRADVMDPVTWKRQRTNTFEFVFSCDPPTASVKGRLAPEIWPVTYEEGMAYLMSRRRHNYTNGSADDVQSRKLVFGADNYLSALK